MQFGFNICIYYTYFYIPCINLEISEKNVQQRERSDFLTKTKYLESFSLSISPKDF